MTGTPLEPQYLDALQDALDTMQEFLDEIARYRTTLTPSLYGPLSYQYDTYVTDGNHIVYLRVINDGSRISTWVPRVGGPIGDGWRYEVTGWADPDDVTVYHVEPVEIPQIVQLREIVESEAPTLEGLVAALTVEDVETIRTVIGAVFEAMGALNEVFPAVEQGATHCQDMENYVDRNWSSDSAGEFRRRVGGMHDSFVDLRHAIEYMIDGDEALLGSFMSFVTAIMEVMDLRREEAAEAWRNVVSMAGGGVSLLGVVVSPASALAWVSLAVSVAGMAGSEDSEDRRQAMDAFQQHAITRAISRAEEHANVAWPGFAGVGFDAADD